jgi:hypothetical protein
MIRDMFLLQTQAFSMFLSFVTGAFKVMLSGLMIFHKCM